MKVGKDLMAASAAPLVLAILAEGESYGYAIVKRVRELSDGEIEWTDGLLYPLLHRLEDAGHVTSRWGASETGRRRRYYEVTPSGRAELAEHRRQWAAVVGALQSAWKDVADAAVLGTMRPGVAL
ncbi:PadR family transcriptional regulator [Demequina phytophila]|uniref:PadR family transcriptional regulator n=1 Tax=Demequina phytophila TaxID=1638981 RepID=UPI000782DB26|nr:helix-turn-helix transcriptional regulator [Demequina phytophila]